MREPSPFESVRFETLISSLSKEELDKSCCSVINIDSPFLISSKFESVGKTLLTVFSFILRKIYFKQ